MPSLLQVYHMVSPVAESCGWASSIGCGVRGSLPRILRSNCRLGGMGLGGLGMRGDLLLSWVNYSTVGVVNHIFEKGYFCRKFLKRPAQQIFLPGPIFSRMATVYLPQTPLGGAYLIGSLPGRLPIPCPLNGLMSGPECPSIGPGTAQHPEDSRPPRRAAPVAAHARGRSRVRAGARSRVHARISPPDLHSAQSVCHA